MRGFQASRRPRGAFMTRIGKWWRVRQGGLVEINRVHECCAGSRARGLGRVGALGGGTRAGGAGEAEEAVRVEGNAVFTYLEMQVRPGRATRAT